MQHGLTNIDVNNQEKVKIVLYHQPPDFYSNSIKTTTTKKDYLQRLNSLNLLKSIRSKMK